ncbi:hypothetical protein [Thermaerobacillus caldiproteolyticus]|uniref:hypothetical protein n=1 Tax=Thermaerobacillus caldiproteolyticus TaxID=247480 RepID=UPI001889CD20|nr:hypothetical protein [Anoxybacillus caldiproteolyticus]QPA33376.1 hypothetical protein ISX45_19185 [Anoxybacillus caldiproteolyticus]
MKKWQLMLCSLGIGVIPTLLISIGYLFVCLKSGMSINILPFLPNIISVSVSYIIYKDNQTLITN